MKVTCTMIFALLALALFAEDATAESKAELRRRRRREFIEKVGGLVTKPYTGKVIRIVNAQKTVPSDPVVFAAKQIQVALSLPVEVVAADASVLDARSLFATNTAAVLLIKDTDGPRVLVAPDDAWGEVNVKALAAGNPSADQLAMRLRKEVWRAMAFMLGAGYSQYEFCLMKPARTLGDLDAITADMPCPEPFNRMIMSATALGAYVTRRTSYQKACEEGWAPAPTNDVQKAIWEKVHSVPKNPMKIEFDPKKGK